MRPEEYYDLLREKKWLGQSVQVHHTNFNDVLHYIPEFRRESFGEGDNVNHYLDKIVRLPVRDDKRTIPVATVSRRYALVQHHEVVKWLKECVEASNLDPRNLNIEFTISEYGERLKLKIKLPGMSFDPGDGYKIDQFIEARNSVVVAGRSALRASQPAAAADCARRQASLPTGVSLALNPG